MIRIHKVPHGKYTVNEYEVQITADMRAQALEFARAIKGSDDQYSRLLPEELKGRRAEDAQAILQLEIQRTYVGKLGEMAFLALLEDRGIACDTAGMFAIYEGQANTDEFDFALPDGRTIDVKTGFRSNHTRLLINQQQFVHLPKDIYVAVRLAATDAPGGKLIVEDSVCSATIKGYAERTYLDRVEYKNFGEGLAKSLSYDRLMGIDRLLREGWGK